MDSSAFGDVSYQYDSQGQLLWEYSNVTYYATQWEYDDAGNILSRKVYDYYFDEIDSLYRSDTYSYTDTQWGDLLTGYNGRTLRYDGIGNLTNDGIWTYAWQHGRQLASMTQGSTTWTYTYNSDGLRTKKTDGTNTYTYIYNGSKLTAMTKGSDTLYFTYDAVGTPLTVTYNGTVYYYGTNLQGDIAQVYNAAGTMVVGYRYNAYGELDSIFGSMASTLGTINPLRYRGYVYDTETKLYYLQSRYYNPQWCRFINADIYASTGQGFVGNNMFAYCGNNPVARSDRHGTSWLSDTLYNIWNVGEDMIWKAGATILGLMGYQLTSDLLSLSASGPNNQYYASGNDYAAQLLKSDEGFINEITGNYYGSQNRLHTSWSESTTYIIPLSNGDLGASLHKISYRYYVDYNWVEQNAQLIVEVTDTFDFTEFKNPFAQESFVEGLLWLANDFAYIDTAWGLLDSVEVTIMLSIPVDPWRY